MTAIPYVPGISYRAKDDNDAFSQEICPIPAVLVHQRASAGVMSDGNDGRGTMSV